MPRALPITYTVESAQAALQLGPVEYVCNVCGRTHVSEKPPPCYCIVARIRSAGKSSWAGGALDALAGAAGRLVTELCDARTRAMGRMHTDVYYTAVDLIDIVYPEAHIISLLSTNSLLHTVVANSKASSQTTWLYASKTLDELAVRVKLRGRHFNNLSWALMAEPDCVHREILRIVRLHLCSVQWPPAHAADTCGSKTRSVGSMRRGRAEVRIDAGFRDRGGFKMKHQLVHQYTCEGCGAVRRSEKELEEFGSHWRKTSLWDTPETVETEAQCVYHAAENKRLFLERQSKKQAQMQSLVEGCAEDDFFRMLAGFNETPHYVGERMDEIAEGMGLDIADLISGGQCGYDDLLTQCVDAARKLK